MAVSPSHREDRERRGADAASAPAPQFILDRAGVRAVDRAAIERYGIPGIVLMENAARELADEALSMLAGRGAAQVLIICGTGNNGGDGYALARHLHNAGHRPVLAPLADPRPGSDAAVNARVCERIGLPVIDLERLDEHQDADLVVDAVFGTGLDRPVSGLAADVIRWMNDCVAPVLAVDVPSGLDCDTGRPLGIAVRADRTVTFVALKPGYRDLAAQVFLGRVVVGDIGAPVELVRQFGERLPHEPPDDRTEIPVPPPEPRRSR